MGSALGQGGNDCSCIRADEWVKQCVCRNALEGTGFAVARRTCSPQRARTAIKPAGRSSPPSSEPFLTEPIHHKEAMGALVWCMNKLELHSRPVLLTKLESLWSTPVPRIISPDTPESSLDDHSEHTRQDFRLAQGPPGLLPSRNPVRNLNPGQPYRRLSDRAVVSGDCLCLRHGQPQPRSGASCLPWWCRFSSLRWGFSVP